MTAILAGITGWFNGLPFKLIACIAAAGVLLLLVFAIYREGKHSAQADELRAVAAHNAQIAQDFARKADAANDIAGAERAKSEELEKQNADLKTAVEKLARGNASPGVDAAVHGVPKPPAAAGKPAVPRPK